MKITVKKLRQIIREAINEAKYYIGDDKGNVQSAIGAFHGGYTKDAVLGNIARPLRSSESNTRAMKAVKMMRSKDLEARNQGRELARTIVDFGMVDDDILQDLKDSLKFTSDGSLELTDIEKTAYDHMPYDKVELDRKDTEQPQALVDKGALFGAMKSKSDGILTRFGFKYVDDIDFDFSQHGGQLLDRYAQEERQEFLAKFRFQARILGCEVKDLAFVDNEDLTAEKTLIAIYDMMREMNATELDISEDVGDFGENNLYDLNGVKLLLTGYGGYSTVTICGQ